MKRSITRRIILSYLTIIMVSLIFTGILFSLAVRGYLERHAARTLRNDAETVVNIFIKSYNGSVQEGSGSFMRKALRDRVLKGRMSVSSEWVIVNSFLRPIVPKSPEELNEFTIQVYPQLEEYLKGNSVSENIKIELDNIEYKALVWPFKAGKLQGGKGYIVMYTPVGPMKNMSRGILVILLLALAVTGGVSVFFGILTARSIAKPIIALKKRAERLSHRDYESTVTIRTGDELEELAVTIEKMANELRAYDLAQKKFLQNASHELRTPLMSIQGYAEGVKDGVFEDNEKALDIISDETARLKKLVEELIYLSKLETMETFFRFEKVSVKEVLEASLEKVRGLAVKTDISFSLDVEDSILLLDRDKILQALINILGNCIRHAKRLIEVKGQLSGDRYVVEITDDGEGFDEEDLKHAFERFYKGRKGKTGLGLAITRVIVERHSGKIELGNITGGGAKYVLVFDTPPQEVSAP